MSIYIYVCLRTLQFFLKPITAPRSPPHAMTTVDPAMVQFLKIGVAIGV